MWGTRPADRTDHYPYRFIPTHVGNTGSVSRRSAFFPVHPHACGEHLPRSVTPHIAHGSSPRMWGTRNRGPTIRVDGRFIPTHVGNTRSTQTLSGQISVHPHACGEHTAISDVSGFGVGSSPRMWGTPPRSPHQRPGARFIPTHVGNTDDRDVPQSGGPVHPHACGEHPAGRSTFANASGSSPRMWGTRNDRALYKPLHRFIPTHVGNTWLGLMSWAWGPVHPHACGEHGIPFGSESVLIGSSPRMWGTPILIISLRAPRRFIPTHVGNTGSGPTDTAALSVHPHACGEHVGCEIRTLSPTGSSPRMWGTQLS